MYSNSKFNLRKFFIALLSMLMAVMLAFSVACNKGDDGAGNDDDDSATTETTPEITDYQLIKNGDFEFGTTEKTVFPYSSSINWSRSLYSDVTSAPSSDGTSGIIDTSADEFTKLDAKNKFKSGDEYVNPFTPYAYGLVSSDYDYEDEDKQSNPQADGTKVLMINNKKLVSGKSNGEGTAQYYKASSSISVPTAEYAVLTFWVKTLGISSLYNGNAGAHVRISSSTASTNHEEILIKDINTNGQWAKFEIYLQGSEVASSSLNFTFGLGRGNGIDHNEYVEGYAFLDNVNVKSLEKDEYEEQVVKGFNLFNVKSDLTDGEFVANATYKDNGTANDDVAGEFTTYTANLDFNVLNTTLRADGTGTETLDFTAKDVDANFNASNKKGFDLTDASDTIKNICGTTAFDNLVYMDLATPSSATYQTKTFTLAKESYNLVTFLVQSKSYHANSDKLKVKVVNEDNEDVELFASIDTTDLESTRYGDWIPYRAFINNPTEEETSYSIKFVFGYDGEWDDVYALQKGYAIIANLSVSSTDEDSYKLASASDYLVKKQIYGKYASFGTESETTSSDVYPVTVDKTQAFSVKVKPATNVSGYTFKSTQSDTSYGIVNSKYHANYTFTSAVSKEAFEGLKVSSNKHAQVLVLDNKTAGYSRFVTEVKTITANTSNKIVVKVKAFDGAKATVSIVDSALSNGQYAVKNFLTSDTDTGVALSSQVLSTSYQKGGWTYVYFYVTAGNEDIKFRVEISNGTASEASVGTVFTEGVTVSSVEEDFSIDAIATDFEALGEGYEFGEPKIHVRNPSTVLTTNEKGETVETTKTYQPKRVYYGNAFAKYVDYSTIHADDIIDNTTSSEDTSTETTEDEGYTLNTDVTLQISSIIIAVVLILVILIILIRNGLKKRNKRRQKTAAYYEEKSGFDRNTREKTLKKIAEKKAKQNEIKVELSDDDAEYDYSLTEVMEEESEELEEVIEETAEETEEETAEETVETSQETSDGDDGKAE